MPRVRPTEVEPSSKSSVDLGRHRRRRRGRRRAAGGRRLPARPAALLQARRARAEGHPPLRPARHRQDAARQGRRARVGRDLLLAERVGLRGDVRRPRRRPHPQALRPRAQARARDRLHRRARRRRHEAQRLELQPRARPDPEPAPRRARRLQRQRAGRHHRRVEPARGSRPGAPAPGPLRPADPRRRRPTWPAARRSSACTRAGSRWPTTSTSPRSRARPPGLTGADLANICNEAAIFAGRAEPGSRSAPRTSTTRSSASSPASRQRTTS